MTRFVRNRESLTFFGWSPVLSSARLPHWMHRIIAGQEDRDRDHVKYTFGSGSGCADHAGSGVKDYEITFWFGVWVRSGTPKPIIAKLTR